MKIVALLFCLCGVTASAQTTWQGLQFGMTRQQATNKLALKNFSFGTEPHAGWIVVSPDFELQTNTPTLASVFKPAVATTPVFYIPELKFDNSGKLQSIKLDMDQARTFEVTPALGNGVAALTIVAGISAYEQLSNKYGVPIAKHGSCETTSLLAFMDSPQCSARWKDTNQSIELFWGYHTDERTLSFRITYSPQSSDL